MRELNVMEIEDVNGAVATLRGYLAACGAGAVGGAMTTWWTGGGVVLGATGGCLIGSMVYGVEEFINP